jgi:hypothetical protein
VAALDQLADAALGLGGRVTRISVSSCLQTIKTRERWEAEDGRSDSGRLYRPV